MKTGLLQLERIVTKNGYSIIPQNLLVDILKNYYGCGLTFGVLEFDEITHFHSEDYEVIGKNRDYITINKESIPRRDINKFLNTFSTYCVFSIEDGILFNYFHS